MANTGFRLAFSLISAAELNNNASYLITSFPVQSDMEIGRDWQRPGNEADRVLQVGEVVESLDGWRAGMGKPEFSWPLRNLSSGMISYIVSQGFTNGAYASDCTVQTYNRNTGAWESYQGIVHRPHESEYELWAGGADEWTLKFIELEAAPDGPDVTVDLQVDDATPTETQTVTFTVDVTNVGDDDTFNAISAIVALDGLTAFQDDASGTGWVFLYSNNSGSSYTDSGGADTTNIRGTYGNNLDTTTTATFSFSMLPPSGSAGIYQPTTTITNSGDTNTGNNSDTVTITVGT